MWNWSKIGFSLLLRIENRSAIKKRFPRFYGMLSSIAPAVYLIIGREYASALDIEAVGSAAILARPRAAEVTVLEEALGSWHQVHPFERLVDVKGLVWFLRTAVTSGGCRVVLIHLYPAARCFASLDILNYRNYYYNTSKINSNISNEKYWKSVQRYMSKCYI